MRETHRHRNARRLPGRILPAGLLLALAAVVGMPGVAFALFSSQPSAQTASITAATIGAPTNFTAATVSGTSATLSWAAPSTLTGYTLSQSPGTLAGCSATPSASTTLCTATGLSPKTAYTWTLTAVYSNWTSASVQANATTFAAVGATLLASATDSSHNTSSTTVSGVNTTSGAALLILVYRQAGDGSIAFSNANPITGTAVGGTSAAITSQTFNAGNNHYAVLAAQATGSGTANGTVIVNFSKGNNVSTTIDVVQLSGNNTSTPIAGSAISTGTGTTANGGSLSPGNSGDGEVFFAGLSGSTTMSTPTGGYAALDVPANTAHGSWFRSSASPSGVTTNLGASGTWGTIEIEINQG
jgi:hypothetical protein